MADAVVTMGARWDGKRLQRGIEQTKKEISGLKRGVQEFSKFASGPLGFLGITGAIASMGVALHNLAEEQRQTDRLVATFERMTAVTPDLRAVNAELVKLRRSSLFGDTELTMALQTLVQLTGDYTGSLKNLTLVADAASASGKGLQEVAKIVGFAMNGVSEQLGEVNPQVRIWVEQNRELSRTAEGSAIALKMLNEQVNNARTADIKGYAGAIHNLKTGFGELRDAVMREMGFAGDNSLSGFFRQWGIEADKAAEKINRKGGLLSTIRALLESAPNFWLTMNELEKGRPPAAPGKPVYSMPVVDPSKFDPRPPDMRSPVTGFVGPDATEWLKEQARLEKEAADAAEMREESYRNMVADRAKLAKSLNDQIKESREEDQRNAEAARLAQVNELQSAFAGAFMSIRSGWEGLVDYMHDYLIQKLAWFIAGKLASAFLPGFGVVGSGIGGGGIINGDGPVINSVGASRAVMQQNAWRMQRSLR